MDQVSESSISKTDQCDAVWICAGQLQGPGPRRPGRGPEGRRLRADLLREGVRQIHGRPARVQETAEGAGARRCVVVVTKLDRLARSSRDLHNILHELQALSCGFVSLGEAWCDT